MWALRAFGIFLVVSSAAGVAKAELEYVRTEGGRESKSPMKGTLGIAKRDGLPYVSIRQFCYAFGCRVFYQWANHRAIIQNPGQRAGAIVSSLTHVALADGKVVEFEGKILSEIGEGYLLPIDLVEKLAPALQLGRVERKEDPKPRQAGKVERAGALQTIVIDPGHGGNDLGTESGGIFEKDVAVIYALKLKEELLRAMPDLEIVLTRDGDRFVSLPDRAKLANAKSANLFLSLHVNHARDPKVDGVETYILSPDATDDEAKRVALLENETWLKSAKIHEAGNVIKSILVDMEQTSYIQNSALAAAMIQQELGVLKKTHGLRDRGVKQAMFYVLSQVAMPSTLVEMGFLSNTGDRSRLMDLGFRDEFVKRLVLALKRYKEKMLLKEAAH